jgi:hypothetical protein
MRWLALERLERSAFARSMEAARGRPDMRLVGLPAAGLFVLLTVMPAAAQTPGQKPTQLPTVQKPSPAVPPQPRLTAPKPPPLTLPSDIDSAVLLVMLEASKSAQEDLKAIMAVVKSANAERALTTAPRSSAAPCSGKTTADWRACLRQIEAKVAKLPPDPDRAALIRSINGKIDSMSDINEVGQLKLQQMMDRRSQLMEMLSNLMTRVSDTNDSLIANVK